MSQFATRELDGVTVIEAEGRLDAPASPRLDRSLTRALEAGPARLVVDFQRVSYISSSCLRVLLLGARRTRGQGGDLKLCCLAGRVRQIFALAGFDLVFELYDTLDQAVAAFAASPGGPKVTCTPG